MKNRGYKLFLIIISILLITSLLAGCSFTTKTLDRIDGYYDMQLGSDEPLNPNPTNPTDPVEPTDPTEPTKPDVTIDPPKEPNNINPPLNGFVFRDLSCIKTDAITRLREIGAWLCFADRNGVWLTDNGVDLLPCAVDLTNTDIEITDYKYIFENSRGYVGLKDIFAADKNDFVINPIYDHIEFKGDTAIAKLYSGEQTTSYLYYKGLLRGETLSKVFMMEDSRFIKLEREFSPEFYDLSAWFEEGVTMLSPADLADVPWEGIENQVLFSAPTGELSTFLIYDSHTELLGYACKTGILIEPQFLVAENFVNNCAQAKYFDGSNLCSVYLRLYHDLDNEGQAIMRIVQTPLDSVGLDGSTITPFYGEYALFNTRTNKYFGVINSDFEIVVNQIFPQAATEIIDGYVLTTQINRFYSIKEKGYVSDPHISISYNSAGGYYICKNNAGKWIILDSNINNLAADNATFDSLYAFGNFILLESAGGFYLYEIEF